MNNVQIKFFIVWIVFFRFLISGENRQVIYATTAAIVLITVIVNGGLTCTVIDILGIKWAYFWRNTQNDDYRSSDMAVVSWQSEMEWTLLRQDQFPHLLWRPVEEIRLINRSSRGNGTISMPSKFRLHFRINSRFRNPYMEATFLLNINENLTVWSNTTLAFFRHMNALFFKNEKFSSFCIYKKNHALIFWKGSVKIRVSEKGLFFIVHFELIEFYSVK